MPSRRTLLALLGILAVSAAIRVYLFRGFTGLDDAEYARLAFQLTDGSPYLGNYPGPAVFPLRVGVTVPAAFLFRVLGVTEWTMVLYPFLLSLCGIMLVFFFSSQLFGHRAGLIAASLTGILPWDIDAATKLLPDLPAAFYAAAAVTLIMLLEQRGEQRRALLLSGGLAAGVGFGLSWLCKETIAYLAPFCIVWMVLTSRRSGTPMLFLWIGVAAGSLAILVGEAVSYHVIASDVLFRFHEVERNYLQWDNGFFTEGSDFGWQRGGRTGALIARLLVDGPSVIFLEPSLLFLPLVGIAATIHGWIRRDRAFLLPALWLWTLVLMFNFSSSSASSYIPLTLYHRYLFPLFFPAVVLVSGFLAQTVPGVGRAAPAAPLVPFRWAGLLSAAVVGWVGGIQLVRNLRSPPEWLSDARTIGSGITPDSVVYADALSLRAFEFLHRYPKQSAWTDLNAVATPAEIPAGSLVLINPAYLEWLDRNAGMWVSWPVPGRTDPAGYPPRRIYASVPAFWVRTWQGRTASVYRVHEADRARPGGAE